MYLLYRNSRKLVREECFAQETFQTYANLKRKFFSNRHIYIIPRKIDKSILHFRSVTQWNKTTKNVKFLNALDRRPPPPQNP